MTGMILIVIGLITFVSGLVVYSNASQNVPTPIFAEVVPKPIEAARIDSTPVKQIETTAPPAVKQSEVVVEKLDNIDDLSHFINMIIADGVFTNNERTSVKKFCLEKSLDYDSFVHDIESRLSTSGIKPETAVIDYNEKNGLDFEKFVVQKFNKKYFTTEEWTGDKFVNGHYSETSQNPDMVMNFRIQQESYHFAVECKWRKEYYKNGLEFSSEAQLERYRKFQSQRDIPVFILIGLGGTGADPLSLYILPLKDINSSFITKQDLKKYQMNHLAGNFFYEYEIENLK